MPYCNQCGTAVPDVARFCGKCGAPQPVTSAPRSSDPLGGLSPRQAALLCYIPLVGWIMSIIVLAADRFRQDHKVRFHAFQALYIFAAWMLVDWIVAPALLAPGFGVAFSGVRTVQRLLKAVLFGSWIFMMIRVSHDDDYHLPIVGDLAERSVSEQRG